jgi:Domain of unknown function (DUF4902)
MDDPANLDSGCVNLRLDTLLSIPLVHFVSGLDEEQRVDIKRDGEQTTISGYTEWVSTTPPIISLGWDWRLDTLRATPWCVRTSPPRSNIRLLDENMREVEWRRAQLALGGVVDALSWQERTQSAIASRYAWFAEILTLASQG